MTGKIEIRALNSEEVRNASDLADLVYPGELYESLECFENKRNFYPKGFLGLFVNGEFEGYVVCHPWNSDKEVPLNSMLNEKNRGNVFYVHDLVINESQRGMGYGKMLLERAVKIGIDEGYQMFMLVAVNELVKKMAEKIGFKANEGISYNGIKGLIMKYGKN